MGLNFSNCLLVSNGNGEPKRTDFVELVVAKIKLNRSSSEN